MAVENITALIKETVASEVFGVWFLIGAALVFFMQAGFAMVERDSPARKTPETSL